MTAPNPKTGINSKCKSLRSISPERRQIGSKALDTSVSSNTRRAGSQVFWNPVWFLMMSNSRVSEVATRFEQDGYAILDRVFSEEEISPVSDEIDRIIAGERTYIPERDLVWEPGEGERRLRNAFRLALYNPLFLEFAKSPKLTGVLGELLGHPLRLYGSQLFAKPHGWARLSRNTRTCRTGLSIRRS